MDPGASKEEAGSETRNTLLSSCIVKSGSLLCKMKVYICSELELSEAPPPPRPG